MAQSLKMRRLAIALAGASLILAAPAFAAVPISSWGFVALFSDTTYTVTANLVEPGGTQGVSGSTAIRVPPSVHDIVIEGGGFTIDGRDTGGTPDLDLGVALSGIASGPVRNVVIRDLRFTDVSTGVSIKDYACRVVVEDCEFAGMVNLAAVELANDLLGAQMRWVTVRDNWFHDGAGIPVVARNTANASGGAIMEHVAVAANMIHDTRRSPGFPEPWNAAILFRDGAADVRVWDNLVSGGQGESGLFMTSSDATARAYDGVSIRGNVFTGATGNIRAIGTDLASGITLDQVTTSSGTFATWTVTGNYLVQNENLGIEFLTGANTPAVLLANGNWWGEDGTVSGTYGNGALNATDAAPRDLPDGILALPDRAGGADRAVADVEGFAGQVVLLNQNNGAPGIRGFDLDYDHAASYAFRRTVEGPFLRRQASLIQFYDIPAIGGSGNERTASAAILGGGTPLALGNGVLTLTVLAGVLQDEATPPDFLLDQVALRDPGNYPIVVAGLGDADRPVDNTPPAAVLTPPGPYPCVGSANAPVGVAVSDDFALEDVAYRFYKVGLDPGCWTALSLDEAGVAYTGPASVIVIFGFGDGAYVFELLATDDAGNVLRAALGLTFDSTPPADFAGTTSALAVPGPGTPGVEEVRFTWSGTFEAGGNLRLRYLPFGGAVGNYAYPEYDDLAPLPGPHFPGPTEGTEVDLPDLSAGSAVVSFTIPQRSYYYFTLYVRDCAGNPSPGTGAAARTNALSYYLGDWDSNMPPACPGSPEYPSGNGYVNFCDLIGLSRAFGTTSFDPDYSNYVDIGPTTPGPSPRDRPTTDNVIDFEDLILFAINYGIVAPLAGENVAADAVNRGLVRLASEVVSRDSERVVIELRVSGDVDQLRGLEAVLSIPGFTVVETRPGSVLPAAHFLRAVAGPDEVSVNIALLGAGERLPGAGVVAEVVLRANQDHPPGVAPRLVRQKIRDRWNRELDGVGGTPVTAVAEEQPGPAVPVAFALAEPQPNPMNPATTVRFLVPVRSEVRVVVYDPVGRLVARLFEGVAEPGEHVLTWQPDRRASGLYLLEMSAGDFRQVRKVLAIK